MRDSIVVILGGRGATVCVCIKEEYLCVCVCVCVCGHEVTPHTSDSTSSVC